jgi:DNA-binding beta-propeller fold protein YncE
MKKILRGIGWRRFSIVLATLPSLWPARQVLAHPGTGIVIDQAGNVYFVDMVSGVWKVDTAGRLTHLPGPGFHWMALDERERLRGATLPSGSAGEVVRLANQPTLILASDYPVSMGQDGSLYYPSHRAPGALQILRIPPSGSTAVAATLPARAGERELRELNGIALGRDGSVYYTENDAVRRIDSRGAVSTIAQELSPAGCRAVAGIDAGAGPLLRGFAVDSSGTVYAAATGCAAVVKISSRGEITTLYRSPGDWSPTGIALFGNSVYVLEFLGAGSDDRRAMVPRVTKIEPTGTTRVIATVRR